MAKLRFETVKVALRSGCYVGQSGAKFATRMLCELGPDILHIVFRSVLLLVESIDAMSSPSSPESLGCAQMPLWPMHQPAAFALMRESCRHDSTVMVTMRNGTHGGVTGVDVSQS
jgi:hypothetical protein